MAETTTPLHEPQAAAPPVAEAPAPAPVDEPPPFLGTWRNVYLLLAGELALLVVAFYVLTRWAS